MVLNEIVWDNRVLFTICGDACPLSCVSAEACLTGWPNARRQ